MGLGLRCPSLTWKLGELVFISLRKSDSVFKIGPWADARLWHIGITRGRKRFGFGW